MDQNYIVSKERQGLLSRRKARVTFGKNVKPIEMERFATHNRRSDVIVVAY